MFLSRLHGLAMFRCDIFETVRDMFFLYIFLSRLRCLESFRCDMFEPVQILLFSHIFYLDCIA